jgi:acetoin utilization deacetylase AcuC-like enzyme
MKTTAFITHPDCARHDMGEFHPESPLRLSAINDRLIAAGLLQYLATFEAPVADRALLERTHTPAHVDNVFNSAPHHGIHHIDPDTAMNPFSLDAALRAAGAATLAVDLVMRGEANNAFCAIRPPGHHAEKERSMGFCIFNNMAVAATHAMEAWGLERIAILDFDVHHGNGTEDILKGEPRVLFCSTFQHPFYPYQGSETNSPNIINIPLAAGTDGTGFRAAIEEKCLPAFDAFAPQLVMISAGFDAHREDPLAHLRLVETDYAWVTEQMMQLARKHAQGRVVSLLEGGYNTDALGRSVAEHIRVLLEL